MWTKNIRLPSGTESVLQSSTKDIGNTTIAPKILGQLHEYSIVDVTDN